MVYSLSEAQNGLSFADVLRLYRSCGSKCCPKQYLCSDGIAGRLRDALICLDVPEDEFYLFIEETKCDEL